MASTTVTDNIKVLHRGRGPGYVTLVENLVTPPINQTAEARQFKFGTYVNHGKY